MHPKVLKALSECLARPMTVIYQASPRAGHLPEQWKEATITAIFKKGRSSDLANYRPVSLTSIPCKIFEKLLREEVLQHISFINLLTSK